MPPTSPGAPRDFGVSAGPVGVDFAAVMARKDKVVGASRSGLEAWLKGMANCTLFEGHARFLSPTTVRVGDDVLEAERFFINVGCRAVAPDFPGLDQVRTLTNTTLLELDALPPASSSSEEAISASSSPRFSAASAPKSQWWKRCRA